MPRNVQILSIFVASPKDVAAERVRLAEIINEINISTARNSGIRLELIAWESHSHPSFGEDTQSVINEQIPADYDIFIGIMWHRFGTPTKRAESGTHEEFLRAKSKWDTDKNSIDLMMYFKDAPISPSQIDGEQIAKVCEFKRSLQELGGLYCVFQSTDEFANYTRLHLRRIVDEFQCKQVATVSMIAPSQSSAIVASHLPSNDQSFGGGENRGSESLDDSEPGLFEYTELCEESFLEAKDVLLRIVKSTAVYGDKMREQTSKLEILTNSPNASRAKSRRIIDKSAKDMMDYAGRLSQDIPLLNELMTTGFEALSQSLSLWPEFNRTNPQLETISDSLTNLQEMRGTIAAAEIMIVDFHSIINTMPRLTGSLNTGKRTVCTALQKLIDVLQTQQRVILNIEELASGLLATHACVTVDQAAAHLNVSTDYVLQLIANQLIPHRVVDSASQILMSDLLQFKQQNQLARQKVLEELAAQAQELDMGY